MNLVERLAEAERHELQRVQTAAVAYRRAWLNVLGVPLQFPIRNAEPGWWRVLVREFDGERAAVPAMRAGPAEVDRYLHGMRRLRALLAWRDPGGAWFAVASQPHSTRVRTRGAFPVLMADGMADLDPVVVAWSGQVFFCAGRDRSRPPGLGAYLRSALLGLRPAEDLRLSGLTRRERDVYGAVLERRAATLRPPTERRLAGALAHGGARLLGHSERPGGVVVVEYEVEGRRYQGIVRDDSFDVIQSGTCLSGRDADFDLASLAGVMRELHRREDE